jgi:O-antigen/teichoic acid export membrane protein
MSLQKAAIRGLTWSLIDRWANKFSRMAIFVILARLLSPKDFGIVALAAVYLDFIDIFVSQGLGFAIIQREDLSDEHLDTAFWIQFVIGLVMAGMVTLFAHPIANIMHQPELGSILRWLALSLLISNLVRIQMNYLVKQMRFETLALRNILSSVIGGGVGIIAAVYGFGVWSLVARQLTESVIGTTILWFASDWRPGFRVSYARFKELYGYGFKVTADSIFILCFRRLDDLLIGSFIGATELGYFSIAKQSASIFNDLILSPMFFVLLPVFSSIQNDYDRLMKYIRYVFRHLFTLSVPLLVTLAAFSDVLINLLYGHQWERAVTPARLLILAAIFQIFPGVIHSIFHATGRPGWPLISNVARGIISCIVFLAMVPFGINGVALGGLICAILVAFLESAILGRFFGKIAIELWSKEFFPVAAGVACMVLFTRCLGVLVDRERIHLFIVTMEILCIAILYTASVFLFRKEIVCEIIDLVKMFLGKKKNFSDVKA